MPTPVDSLFLKPANLPFYKRQLTDMADPRNAHRVRAPHPSIVAAAAVAAGVQQRVLPNFWEEEQENIYPLTGAGAAAAGGTDMDAEDAERELYLSERKRETDQDRESRRDERQYRTAFRTAFELGMKAGRMQRAEPQPCAACERRKERNRIAAQASRFEKRRLERTLAGLTAVEPPRRRRATGGAVPPPFIPVAPRVATATPVTAPLESDESDEEPPPF